MANRGTPVADGRTVQLADGRAESADCSGRVPADRFSQTLQRYGVGPRRRTDCHWPHHWHLRANSWPETPQELLRTIFYTSGSIVTMTD